MWIALLPPTTCETEYFGGIDASVHVHDQASNVLLQSCFLFALPVREKLFQDGTCKLSYITFCDIWGYRLHDTCIPILRNLNFYNCSSKYFFSVIFERVTEEGFRVFQELSNSVSPPVKPGA